MTKTALFAFATLAFTALSFWIVADAPDGLILGVFTSAGREPWALQVLLDLTIAIGFFVTWMIRDARQRGIPAWPYVVLCVLLGSIGALAYLTHRSAREVRRVPVPVT